MENIFLEQNGEKYIIYRCCSHGFVPLLITKNKDCATSFLKTLKEN